MTPLISYWLYYAVTVEKTVLNLFYPDGLNCLFIKIKLLPHFKLSLYDLEVMHDLLNFASGGTTQLCTNSPGGFWSASIPDVSD